MWILVAYLAVLFALSIQPAVAGRSRLGLGLASLPKAHQLDKIGLGAPSDLHSDSESGRQSAAAAGLPLVGNGTFEQYIDHTQPELGKFTQHYKYNATNWKGPGSPIVVNTPAESGPLDDMYYLTRSSLLPGMIAEQVGGAVIVLEMRYMGDSTPFELYNTTALQYLTLDQVVADFVRFPWEAELPFVPAGSCSKPDQTPWIWVGGSLSGTLGVWIERRAPGTYWATHASSAPVETILDWWQWAVPMHEGMPRNCSADWSAIFDHVDNTFWHGTDEQKSHLKAMFGLGGLEYPDDVAAAIARPIGAWGDIDPSGDYSDFFGICDAIEGYYPDHNITAPPDYPPDTGIGLEQALPNYAKWYREKYLPGYCSGTGYQYPEWTDPHGIQCFDYHNASSPFYAVTPDNNFNRFFAWMQCTWPNFNFEDGPPPDYQGPTLYPRLITKELQLAQCGFFFPPDGNHSYYPSTMAVAEAATADFNARQGGWDFTGTHRMFHVNGEFDIWRELSVASDFRPGGPFEGTEQTPSYVIKGGTHVNDFLKYYGKLNKDIAALQGTILTQFKTWVDEFYAQRKQ